MQGCQTGPGHAYTAISPDNPPASQGVNPHTPRPNKPRKKVARHKWHSRKGFFMRKYSQVVVYKMVGLRPIRVGQILQNRGAPIGIFRRVQLETITLHLFAHVNERFELQRYKIAFKRKECKMYCYSHSHYQEGQGEWMALSTRRDSCWRGVGAK